MKIISLGPAYPYRGGLADFNNRLTQQLVAEGHEAEILTFTLQYPGFLFPGKSQYSESPPPKKVKITRILSSVNPLTWIATGLRIKNEKPDILLLRYWIPFMAPCLGSVARIARLNGHTRVICIFDNVIPHEKRAGDRMLTKYFAGSIHGAIVMSGSVLSDLSSFRNDIPVRLSPHPLFENYGVPVTKEAALFRLKLEENYKYILFFGLVRAYKGLDILLQAFSDQRLRNFKLKLIIAGEFYDDVSLYRAMIKKYKIENEVIVNDRFIKDDEVTLFFSAASLVVQPYKSATQSGVTQIAFSFGKPMIVTDVGGLGETVPDGVCGYVVKPDSRDVADAIVDYFENNREAQFSEGVKREKERFSWDRMTASILEVCKESLIPHLNPLN
jgi:glycosyltransferase involved in cell wall biosynthesis